MKFAQSFATGVSTWELLSLRSKPSILYLLMVEIYILLAHTLKIFSTPRASCEGGDCLSYSQMTLGYSSGKFTSIESPFNGRLLAPFIASVLTPDTVLSFQILNTISFGALTAALFLITKALSLGNLGFLALASWFALHPLGMALYLAVPVSVDPLAYALMSWLLYFFLLKKNWGYAVVLLIGILTKESFLFLAFVGLLAQLRIHHFTSFSALPRFAGSQITVLMAVTLGTIVREWSAKNLFTQAQPWPISFQSTITWWLNEVVNDPNRLLVWLAALLCAIGFFGSLVIWSDSSKFINANVTNTTFLLGSWLAFCSLGLLGGSDMSRIIFNGNVFGLVFLLLLAQAGKKQLKTFLALLLGLTMSLSYTRFFPSTIEYSYYEDSQNLILLLFFSAAMLLANISLALVFRTSKKTFFLPQSP